MDNIRLDDRTPGTAFYSRSRSVVALCAANEDKDLEPGFLFIFSSGTTMFICQEALDAMQVAMNEARDSATVIYGEQ